LINLNELDFELTKTLTTDGHPPLSATTNSSSEEEEEQPGLLELMAILLAGLMVAANWGKSADIYLKMWMYMP